MPMMLAKVEKLLRASLKTIEKTNRGECVPSIVAHSATSLDLTFYFVFHLMFRLYLSQRYIALAITGRTIDLL